MTEGIGAAAAAGAGGAGSIFTPAGGAMGKDEFLQLLVAQLQNQDPMNPMESQEFAAQLAQFSSVEQLINLNDKFDAQSDYTTALAQAMNSSAAVSVLGREVLAEGDAVQVTGGEATLDVDVGAAGGTGVVRLYDRSDRLVAELEVGAVAGGRQSLDLVLEGVEDGGYRYEIDVTTPAGEEVTTTSYTRGTVSGVKYSNEGPVLMIGTMTIPLSAVVEVSAN